MRPPLPCPPFAAVHVCCGTSMSVFPEMCSVQSGSACGSVDPNYSLSNLTDRYLNTVVFFFFLFFLFAILPGGSGFQKPAVHPPAYSTSQPGELLSCLVPSVLLVGPSWFLATTLGLFSLIKFENPGAKQQIPCHHCWPELSWSRESISSGFHLGAGSLRLRTRDAI